jgi:ABC-type transport system substrate-binding protein
MTVGRGLRHVREALLSGPLSVADLHPSIIESRAADVARRTRKEAPMAGRGLRPGTAAGTAAVLVLAGGCSFGGSAGEDPGTNGVVIGITEPRHLLPTNTVEPNGAQVLASLFTPLVEFDAKRNPVPAAAASIKPDPTNRVWTIKLKPGITFSNGEPVTADNYLAAWNYGAYGPHEQNAASYFAPIDGYASLQSVDPDGPGGPRAAPKPAATTLSGLRKLDETTFTVTLAAPFAGWDSVLGAAAFYPLPDAAFSAPDVIAGGFEDAVIGNGPFRMVGTWKHGSGIRVERVSAFAGRAPKVDTIIWKIYERPDDAYADLAAGDLDVLPQLPVDRIAKAREKLGDRLRSSPNSSFTFVGFPAYEPEYAKATIRRALSMAIDRKAMTDQIFLGSQAPATAFVAPVVAGYRPDTCGANCQYRPAEARKLYESANGPRTVTISYNEDGSHQAWVDAMCAQIRTALGITCTGSGTRTFADLLTQVGRKEPVGMIRAGWVMDYPLMEDYLSQLYATGGASNHYGYSNPAFDSLLKQGAEETRRADAIKRWQEAEDVLVQDMPVIPLRFGLNIYGHSKRVTTVTVDPFQRVDVYSLTLTG